MVKYITNHLYFITLQPIHDLQTHKYVALYEITSSFRTWQSPGRSFTIWGQIYNIFCIWAKEAVFKFSVYPQIYRVSTKIRTFSPSNVPLKGFGEGMGLSVVILAPLLCATF